MFSICKIFGILHCNHAIECAYHLTKCFHSSFSSVSSCDALDTTNMFSICPLPIRLLSFSEAPFIQLSEHRMVSIEVDH